MSQKQTETMYTDLSNDIQYIFADYIVSEILTTKQHLFTLIINGMEVMLCTKSCSVYPSFQVIYGTCWKCNL